MSKSSSYVRALEHRNALLEEELAEYRRSIRLHDSRRARETEAALEVARITARDQTKQLANMRLEVLELGDTLARIHHILSEGSIERARAEVAAHWSTPLGCDPGKGPF
jgi:hypothetical protein